VVAGALQPAQQAWDAGKQESLGWAGEWSWEAAHAGRSSQEPFMASPISPHLLTFLTLWLSAVIARGVRGRQDRGRAAAAHHHPDGEARR